MPIVSVVMPVYNGDRFLRQAIDSILKQAFTDFEFIIINDGSTDSSAQIIASYSDNRIRVITNENNLGIIKSLNRGIESSIGEFICRMDADDLSLCERLQHQVKFLVGNPDIALVGTNTIIIDSNGKKIGEEHYPLSTNEIRKRILSHNPFAHGTVLARASVIKKCGGYDSKFLHNEDYDLWLKISTQYPVANLPLMLVQRRVHDTNITVTKKLELVRYRYLTLKHAVFHYYRNPLLGLYLIRPIVAYGYRYVRSIIRK